MRNLSKILSFILILCMILPCAVFVSGADEYEIIKDGLVSWFDGTNNTKTGHNSDATVWEDLAGDNDVTVLKNTENYFNETAYHLNSNKNTFPKDLLDLINGNWAKSNRWARPLRHSSTVPAMTISRSLRVRRVIFWSSNILPPQVTARR